MKIEDIKLVNGENSYQKAEIERNDKTIDYETNKNLTYVNLLSIQLAGKKRMNVIDFLRGYRHIEKSWVE